MKLLVCAKLIIINVNRDLPVWGNCCRCESARHVILASSLFYQRSGLARRGNPSSRIVAFEIQRATIISSFKDTFSSPIFLVSATRFSLFIMVSDIPLPEHIESHQAGMRMDCLRHSMRSESTATTMFQSKKSSSFPVLPMACYTKPCY